ncbi:unnamed protein product, partial [Dicrocoelium dendriticum]
MLGRFEFSGMHCPFQGTVRFVDLGIMKRYELLIKHFFSCFHAALDLLAEAISVAGFVGKVVIGMDVASSEMWVKGGRYNMCFKDKQQDPNQLISGDKLLELYSQLLSHYPIVTIEDPFDQDDWEHWIKFRSRTKVQVSRTTRHEQEIECAL